MVLGDKPLDKGSRRFEVDLSSNHLIDEYLPATLISFFWINNDVALEFNQN